MATSTIADLYKYAALATASYVRVGDLPLGQRTDGQSFVNRTVAQDRLPTELGRFLFQPTAQFPNPNSWTVSDYYGGDASEFKEDKSGFAATLFQQGTEKVLAIRGTEATDDPMFGIPTGLPAGVDLVSADLAQIGMFGLALTQVVSMANYVMRLRGGIGDLVPQIRVGATLTRPTSGWFVEAQGSIPGSSVYLTFEEAVRKPGLGKLELGDHQRAARVPPLGLGRGGARRRSRLLVRQERKLCRHRRAVGAASDRGAEFRRRGAAAARLQWIAGRIRETQLTGARR